MADSYICSKAKIRCSCGDRISTLTVLPSRTVWLTGEPQANISDHQPMVNIAPFGKCHTVAYPPTRSATEAAHGVLTPMPCIPNTPFPWMGGKTDVILQGAPALLKSSSCRCAFGGTITIAVDGQTDNSYQDLTQEPAVSQEQLEQEGVTSLTPEELLDGLQMALDAAGMFPGVGAIPDLLNACISVCRGNWADAGLSLVAAVPGIGDAAGAAKMMKNGAKMAQKTKTLQKASSGADELAAARTRKQAKIHREQLVEKGISEGKVTRLETKKNVELRRDASTGQMIEVNKPTSISRVETTKASTENPYRKVTPITYVNKTGSSTDYGAGNSSWNNVKNVNPQPKEENAALLKFNRQNPGHNEININAVDKFKETRELVNKIGINKKPFGL